MFELLDKRIRELIEKKGFLQPTKAQELVIEPILNGEDILLIAPTGIGKTEGVMLPLFHKLVEKKHEPTAVLYITPLRSLNRDLLDRLVWWADKLDLDIAVRHGDTSAKERTIQREMPSDIFIVTPETLQAILTGKIMKKHLSNVKYVVIDEIHELVESKRGVQLSVALERLRQLAGDFQRIALSATVGSPETVAAFLGKDVRIINAEAVKAYDIKVEDPKPGKKDKLIADDILIGIETTARLRRLYDLIQKHNSVLAFTNTRETAEVLSSRLRSLDKELKQAVHHGSLSKERRIKSEQEFKQQLLKSLIATSSLELGIDIGSIDLVIQYLSPRQATRLIQRVGRSGHKVTEVSKGVLLSGDEDLFESTVIANRAMQKELEEIKVHENALDVLATQIIGLAIDEYDIADDKVYKIIKMGYPYRNMDKKDFLTVLKFLETLRLVWLDPTAFGYKIRRRKRSWQHYFDNLSTIPDTTQYRIISVIENEPIGVLDEEFVAEHGFSGERFVCSGRAWRIIQVDGNKVMVEPIEDIESAIPAWEGELIPVPFSVAQDVGKLRKKIEKNLKDKDLAKNLAKILEDEYHIDKNSSSDMIRLIEKQNKTHPVPDDKNFLIETYRDFIIIHSCCGSLINDTLGRYIAAVLTTETGVSVNIKTDPYRIIIQTVVKPEKLKEILQKNTDLEEVLIKELERSSLFKWRFLQIAKRFGIIAKKANYEKINVNKIISQYLDSPVYKETLREIFLEKMDLEKAGDILEMIKKNKIKLAIRPGLSYLGELGLLHQFSEVMKPRIPQQEIFNAFKRRLLATRVRLLCLNCGQYNIVKSVREIEQEPECPKCTSRLLAVLRRHQIGAVKLVNKKLKKKELTKEELREFQNIRRSADLVLVYGKKAVLTLAGRGIGPQTAARILSMLQPTKEKLLKDILEAEKEFIRTKKYWK
jgi:ATP-dependent Lhr-like helicase